MSNNVTFRSSGASRVSEDFTGRDWKDIPEIQEIVRKVLSQARGESPREVRESVRSPRLTRFVLPEGVNMPERMEEGRALSPAKKTEVFVRAVLHLQTQPQAAPPLPSTPPQTVRHRDRNLVSFL